jgi:hypothetical protein
MVEWVMAELPRVPALHDVVRIATADHDETVRRYVEHLKSRPPPWTYDPVRRAAPPLLAHATPLEGILRGCGTRGHKGGRSFNVAVAKLVWEAGEGRCMQCHPLSPLYFDIRPDLRLRIPADFYLVEDGLPVVFWLQPRKSITLDDFQRRLMASVVRQRIGIEWDNFGFEILDTSATESKGPRLVRAFTFDDMPPLPELEVATVMQRFADAYDAVSHMDLGIGRGARKRPDAPPPGDTLFDR